MQWLEILPKEEGKEVRETYIVYESLERAFERIRNGEYPPEMPSDAAYRKERKLKKLKLVAYRVASSIFAEIPLV